MSRSTIGGAKFDVSSKRNNVYRLLNETRYVWFQFV